MKATDGDAGFTLMHHCDGDPWPGQVPNPMPALKAAKLIRNIAYTAWSDAVTTARGAGKS